MEQHQVRRLPVVEDGRLLGMISIGDLAVKADARKSGEALEGVSRGVKQDGDARGKSKRKSSGRIAARNEKTQNRVEDREERMREQSGRREHHAAEPAVRKGDAARALPRRSDQPGISSRARGEEDKRQARVLPFRDEAQAGAKTGRKRKAS
jgi:hypothetical protein